MYYRVKRDRHNLPSQKINLDWLRTKNIFDCSADFQCFKHACVRHDLRDVAFCVYFHSVDLLIGQRILSDLLNTVSTSMHIFAYKCSIYELQYVYMCYTAISENRIRSVNNIHITDMNIIEITHTHTLIIWYTFIYILVE